MKITAIEIKPGMIIEHKNDYWNVLKSIGTTDPKIKPENLVYFGLRDFEPAEKQVIEEASISNFTVEQLRDNGVQNILSAIIKKFEDADEIYISFDVDSMDCDQISYGTGTPVKSGFLPDEINQILAQLLSTQKVVCLEIAEINPLLDNKGNKMAETAFQILSNFEQQLIVL